MSWAIRDEAAYWGGELRWMWRVALGLGVISVVALLPWNSTIMFYALLVAIVGVPAVAVVRRVIVWNRLAGVLLRRWQRRQSQCILKSWPDLAHELGLKVRGIYGQVVVAGISRPSWRGARCLVPITLPQGLVRSDLVARAQAIQQAFSACRVSVQGEQISQLVLHIDYVDALADPFDLPLAGSKSTSAAAMGRRDNGAPWELRLGPHTLVAGASGSGKASMVWGLLLGLARPIHSGAVEVWGVDLKGGMELALGSPLLTRFADNSEAAVVMLEEAVTDMQQRARALAGITRQHQPSPEHPLVIVLIDELAALTSYETDRDLLRRANAAIARIASQGRAVGYMLFACLQDPRKETLPARGLFMQTIGLRLRDSAETAMVLGDGAAAGGAMCHTISRVTPGIAFVVDDETGEPIRVRAGFANDQHIRDTAERYPAPRQRPVVVPASQEEGSRPRRRRRESSSPRRTQGVE